MAVLENPMRAYRNAREAFRMFNKARKRRKARKAGELNETETTELFTEAKEIGMLEGKKTYIGIIIAGLGFVLGWAGVGGEEEATQLVTKGAELFGLLMAMYGRYAAKT